MALLTMDIPSDVDRQTLFNATYLGPVMPWIDPVKEANAWKGIVRGGAGTEAEWIRARGQSPQEVKRQRMRETEFNRKHGLVLIQMPPTTKELCLMQPQNRPGSRRKI
ncbi:phage portal protein, lambda family [Citrobacter koseri]|nr:phage portal protein, lambda family [Citrobacter koseri]